MDYRPERSWRKWFDQRVLDKRNAPNDTQLAGGVGFHFDPPCEDYED